MVIHAFQFSWSEWPVPWFAGASLSPATAVVSHLEPRSSLGKQAKVFHCQLTAVTTRYPLTSIALPYRGLKVELTEVTCFFEVYR